MKPPINLKRSRQTGDANQRRLERLVRRFYGPKVMLVAVKSLKAGMEIVRSRIGGVVGNPGLMCAEVVGSYPVADGNYFVACKDGGGENVHGEKMAIVLKPSNADLTRGGDEPKYNMRKATNQPEGTPAVAVQGVVRDREPRYSKMDITRAVTACCTCGGGGPGEKHTCPACEMYHALVTTSNAPHKPCGTDDSQMK
jgi:hypothetical protein